MNEPPWGSSRARSAPGRAARPGSPAVVSVTEREVGAGAGRRASSRSRGARRAAVRPGWAGNAPSERGTVVSRPFVRTGCRRSKPLRPTSPSACALASSLPSPEGTVRARKIPTRAVSRSVQWSTGRAPSATNSPGSSARPGPADVVDVGVDAVAVCGRPVDQRLRDAGEHRVDLGVGVVVAPGDQVVVEVRGSEDLGEPAGGRAAKQLELEQPVLERPRSRRPTRRRSRSPR